MLPRVLVERITAPDEPDQLISHVVSTQRILLCDCELGWDGIPVRPLQYASRAILRDAPPCKASKSIIKSQLITLRKWQGSLEQDELAALDELM